MYFFVLVFLVAIAVAAFYAMNTGKGSVPADNIGNTANSTTNNPESAAEEIASTTAIFDCDDAKSITATFYPKNDTRVDLRLSDGRALSVPRAISASGARYANADESFVFWNKGDTAFITENGTTTFENCAIPATAE